MSVQYFPRRLYRLAPASSTFLVVWSPSGGTRGISVVFEAVDVPAQHHFEFLTLLIMFVLSLYVMLSIESTYFHVGMCGHGIGMWLFGECPCTIHHSWQQAGSVYMYLRADGKIAF